jgi:hypothetical protein
MKDHSSNLFLRVGDKEEITRCLLELEDKPLESKRDCEDNQELHKS